MPTYEYQCNACQYEMEAFQSMSAEPLVECSNCKKESLKRVISGGAGVLFKGSGFYETDYRSEGYKKKASEENKKASLTTSEKKTETKKTTTSEAT